jgi:hypothetical protein
MTPEEENELHTKPCRVDGKTPCVQFPDDDCDCDPCEDCEVQFTYVDNLKKITKKYVQAKIEMTKCQQKHFKQLCSRCGSFHYGCKVYDRYCAAWMRLERKVNE